MTPASTLTRPNTGAVALVGTPNCGKTTLFNALTGLRQKVANYPGVTVERKDGLLQRAAGVIRLLDLPGVYSLDAQTPEEKVVRDILSGERHYARRPAALLAVIDGSALERSLSMLASLLPLGIPTAAVVTMADEVKARGGRLDTRALSKELGLPVVAVVGHRGVGLEEVRGLLDRWESWPTPPAPALDAQGPAAGPWGRTSPLAPALDAPASAGPATDDDGGAGQGPAAPERGADVLGDAALPASAGPASLADWRAGSPPGTAGPWGRTSPLAPALVDGAAPRYAWAVGVLARCRWTPLEPDTVSRRIDHVVLHPVAGPLVFLGVMAFFFQAIFSWAQPAMEGLTALFGWLGQTAGARLPDGLLKGLVVNGLIDGVGGIVVFLPQILILFFLLFLFEDVGYMARAAFLMDRVMGWAGLQGRSFVSLISSYACAVPGIMAARTIPSPHDRLATILVSPFMTCSARLPVYALLIGAFVPDLPVLGPLRLQGLVLFGLYVLGSASAFGAAWVLRRTLLQGDITPFYMELPPYRFPTFKTISLGMLDRAGIFLRRVGRIILPVSVLLWALLAFPRATVSTGTPPAQAAAQQVRHSLAGRLGRALEPVFTPVGFDWRVNIALVGSLAAREVAVSVLAQTYAVEMGNDDAPLKRVLTGGRDAATGAPFMTLATALSLLVFFVYALQCMSTLAVMRRETGGWTWPAFAFAYMFALAWLASFLTYRGALLFGL